MNNAKRFAIWSQLGVTFALLLALGTTAHAAQSITYYHWDALGSPVAATDETGNVKWREQYQPYGEKIRNEPAAVTNTRAYTGHPHDNATGLTYMGARFYDPAVGRFMAVDPKNFSEGNLHSFNRYNYGNNSPYKYIDPNGESGVFFAEPPILFRPIIEYAPQPVRLALPKPNPNGAPTSPSGVPLQRPGETLGQYGRRLEEGVGQRRESSIPNIKHSEKPPAIRPSKEETRWGKGLELVDALKEFFDNLPLFGHGGPTVGATSDPLTIEHRQDMCGGPCQI